MNKKIFLEKIKTQFESTYTSMTYYHGHDESESMKDDFCESDSVMSSEYCKTKVGEIAESYWKKYIHTSLELQEPTDYLDCSFVCRNVYNSNGCDLFLMVVI